MKLRDGARRAPLWRSKVVAEGSGQDFRVEMGNQTLKKNQRLSKT